MSLGYPIVPADDERKHRLRHQVEEGPRNDETCRSGSERPHTPAAAAAFHERGRLCGKTCGTNQSAGMIHYALTTKRS
jgi:hypothetical protein